jgi:hypothetical protein
MLIFEKISMQRGVEQNPPKNTGGFYSTPLLEGRGGGGVCLSTHKWKPFRLTRYKYLDGWKEALPAGPSPAL